MNWDFDREEYLRRRQDATDSAWILFLLLLGATAVGVLHFVLEWIAGWFA